jgi:hypothetical protein
MLEGRDDPDLHKPWHMVIIRVGEPHEDAAARYEAEHGAIGDDSVIRVELVAPTQRLAA